MAYAMTKRGSLDNCITYEFICDTIADMNAIENIYRTIGTIAIVLSGESEGMEVYIAGSNKQWNSLSSLGGAASGDATGGLHFYICGQNEVDLGLPDVDEPDETTIYLVPAGNTSGNLFEEYIYVNDAWEKFGGGSINNIDLSNYIQKTDIATQSTAGLVKILDNGNVTFNENNQLVLTLAGTAVVKTGQSDHPISVTHQHEAAFYGLAKAAGLDMKNSNNAVGTYTTEAASAIRTMIGAGTYSKPAGGIPAADLAETYLTQHQDISGLASKESPVFTGSMSLNRKANSTVGLYSVALGSNVTASGKYAYAEGDSTTASGQQSHTEGHMTVASGYLSHAEGEMCQALAPASHAEGQGTIANSYYEHTGGLYNRTVPTTVNTGTLAEAEEFDPTKTYYAGDIVKYNNRLYCAIRNPNTKRYPPNEDQAHWHKVGSVNSEPDEWNSQNTYANLSYVKLTTDNTVEYYQNHSAITTAYVTPDDSLAAVFWSAKDENTEVTIPTYLEVIGNGGGERTLDRSNARALDIAGNERLMGNVYVGCNADSTGGNKVATEAQVTALTARVAELESQITSLTNALNALLVPANAVVDESGTPMMDELGRYIEFDVPSSGT